MAKTKTILVVEDVMINRQILCSILGDGYETIQAENGKEALDKLETHTDEVFLILLDIIMPVMDGYAFLAAIKDHPEHSRIPVIVTTSNDSEEDEVKALSMGATDFIRKPYRPQIVRHRVDGIVNLRETAAMVNLMKYDQLTKLYSKEYFFNLAIDRINQNPDKKYDLICSDIKKFSLINDMYGYQVGNDLLKMVAGVLNDFVGDDGLCSRLNADTFGMLIRRPEKYSDQVFEDICAKVYEVFGRCRLNIDFGIYPCDDLDCTINVACDRAFLAIAGIKGKYTENYAFYDENMRHRMLREQELSDSMENALEEKQFFVLYQPKYCLKTSKIVGAEALVRWNRPNEGMVSPGEFVPIFESNGFITKLDRYVWEEVCIMIRKCIDAGVPMVPISFNVSRADLFNPQIPEIIWEIVEKYGLEPKMLHPEITESVYMDQPQIIVGAVSRLSEMGFTIEMDDFGTGYSSLNMLSELPIDILKLDMKFIQSDNSERPEKSVMYFVVALAKWLDLKVIAEGVETVEQVEKLRAMDCDEVQGYYFSKPRPEEEFIKLLIDNV